MVRLVLSATIFMMFFTSNCSWGSIQFNDKDICSTIQSVAALFRNSTSAADLFKRSAIFSEEDSNLHKTIFGDSFLRPLDQLNFNCFNREIIIGKNSLEIVDLLGLSYVINGSPFKWDRKLNYYQNFYKFTKLKAVKTHASLIKLLLSPDLAQAQNRNEFPEFENDQDSIQTESINVIGTGANAALPIGYGIDTLTGTIGCLRGTCRVPSAFSKALRGATEKLVIFSVVAIATQKAFALGSPTCEEQSRELKQIMNRNKISLSKFECSYNSPIFEQGAKIGFWTTDAKQIVFSANWQSSELWVDRSREVYHFGYDKLEYVEHTGPGNRKLSDYQKSLEPYRQVIFEIGQNNSCHKCSEYFNSILLLKKPGIYDLSKSIPPQDQRHVTQ